MQDMKYTEKLKSCFAENGGKLFFTDGFKNRAFSAVKEILTQASPESTLCVVRNFKTAQQINAKLGRNAEIIASFDDFKKLCGSDMSQKPSVSTSDGFRKKHPNVIVTLEASSGSAALHAGICRYEGKAGEYTAGENAMYTVSDFLADAQYSLIIVDSVYDAFRFEEADRDTVHTKKPQKYERIDLMDKSYFTDVEHSYKKLKRMVDSADQAIVVSNTLVDKDIISFYAAASLINSDFSYKAAKKIAKAKSFDYNDEIDRVFDSISYSQTDETIQSMCLQRAKGRSQIIPRDIEKLGEYSMGNLNFMTKEEIFLRTVAALTVKNRGLSNEALINLLEDDQTLANAVCDIFFSDELKGDIESKIKNSHIAHMDQEDINVFFEVFEKYGIYCSTGKIDNKCDIYRIYHDDSGFEDLVRRSAEDFDRNENALCASHMGDDVSYKCVATKNLLDSGALKTPLLVVSEKDASTIVDSLSKITPLSVSLLGMDETSVAKDTVSVVDYDSFESVANDINVSSVVFFDAIGDLNKLDTFVKKAINLHDNVNSALLVTYDNISGVLVDLWQERWLSEENDLLAIRNNEVYLRGEKPLDYVEIINELDSIYALYKNLVDGIGQTNSKSVAKRLTSAISDFTLGRAAYVSDIEEDFRYFGMIAPYYAGAFANSVSIGACERPYFAEKIVEPLNGKKKKKKNKNLKYEPVAEASQVSFDVCSKYLHGTCDIKTVDCSVCPLHNNSLANRSAIFKSSVEGYFEKSKKLMEKIRDDRIERKLDDTIITRGNDNAELTQCIESLKKSSDRFKGVIKSIPNSSDAPYYLGYDTVFEIKEAMQSVHFRIFKKYYNQITDILEKATNEMKKSFDAVGQGAKSSLHTL